MCPHNCKLSATECPDTAGARYLMLDSTPGNSTSSNAKGGLRSSAPMNLHTWTPSMPQTSSQLCAA
jgi:hypothetical protein